MKQDSDGDDWLLLIEKRLHSVRFSALYWVSVFLFIAAVVGALWSLPVPEEFLTISPILNWGSVLLMVTAIYYFIISLPLAIGMLPFLLGLAALQLWLASSLDSGTLEFLVCGLAAVGGIAIARRSVGPVIHDLLLSMLVPAYLLSRIYRRLGIPI